MVTKRALGIGYLAGTGTALSIALVYRLAFVGADGVTVLGLVSGLLLSASLVYAGLWLRGSGLDGERIWAVAQWSGLGIGVPTLAAVATVLLYRVGPTMVLDPTMLISNVAAGGVAGVLLGSVSALREENETVRRLHERNAVLNRVLRHNIRNEMNVVSGYAENLERELDGSRERDARVIRRKADAIADLGKKARQVENALERKDPGDPIDVVGAVEECVERARERHPEASVVADLPDREVRAGDDLLSAAIDDLIENAIEHNDDTPEVRIAVEPAESGGVDAVEIGVEDDGPGIPDPERTALSDGGEDPLGHASGIGLWVVKWTVERYGGSLEFEENEPTGTVVWMRIPAK